LGNDNITAVCRPDERIYPIAIQATLLSAIYWDQRLLVLQKGPLLPSGWALVVTADFNGDAKPDYSLYNEHPANRDLVSEQ